ncbi:SCUBE1 [Branchiostoma lanceolatum]|uniref:SCUBE1 protein n=1 Tax=Branchiostoma lanceolatum TaxID=7740 RepID=A0A8S4MMH2_BRALA|nr:SCUBE1 [Branchiostoma lanceolatum]
MSEFATRAEADWKMTLSTFTAQASQSKSSSWWHGHESKTESKQSDGQAAAGSQSKANRKQEKQASSQEYSSEELQVQGGDQQIAAAITEMYTTALTTELKDWLESIDDYPKPFSFVLRLVSDLLNIPFASLFPSGKVDYGCFGKRNLQIEEGTGRKYYIQETTKLVGGNKGSKNVSDTVTVSESRYCNFANRKDLENSMTKKRLSLERAVTVYLEEGRLLSSDFLLPAGEAGCETAMLAFLQGDNTGVPSWEDMTGEKEFTVVFDMPYDIPGILQAQDVLELKLFRHKWFSNRRGSAPHLYDGYKNGGSNDVQGKRVSVQGLVMTYDDETGVFTVTDDDFEASAPLIPDLPNWIKGRDIARAEYKKLLNHLSQKSETVGDVPCGIQWSNAHRFDPTDGGKCIHFTAASEGDIFVVFASIPKNHETWIYIQISPEGVALYKALRLQTTQLSDNAGGLGSAILYQSYFVCVTEDVEKETTVIQYGKTPDNEERPHVWLSFTFHELASLRYYSFGSGESPVKVMGLSLLNTPANDFIICRQGTEMVNGVCQQKCHSECEGCRTSGSNSPTDCIACKHQKVTYPYREGETGDFECVAQCPQHMQTDSATKTCTCIKRMEKVRPGGVVHCVTDCPLTDFDDNNVCKKCSTFCADVIDEGNRVCSGPASKDCETCQYKHEGRCVEGCSPGQKAVRGNGAFTCHQCQSGHECRLGDETEDICPAGTASNDDRTMCEPCAAGEFSGTPGAATCQKCSPGNYRSSAASTGCNACVAGTYSRTAGSRVCEPCAAGEFSDNPGAASCQKCPAGTYSNSAASTGCSACEAGTYSSSAGSTDCKSCPSGYNTFHRGQSTCIISQTIGPKKWREDGRCGQGYPAEDGSPAECDPDGINPCCSQHSWCGPTAAHCDCQTCVDYRNKQSVGPKKWREDGRCGQGYPAEDGSPAECDPDGINPCCSQHSWCGPTAAHCDCQTCVDYRNKQSGSPCQVILARASAGPLVLPHPPCHHQMYRVARAGMLAQIAFSGSQLWSTHQAPPCQVILARARAGPLVVPIPLATTILCGVARAGMLAQTCHSQAPSHGALTRLPLARSFWQEPERDP